MGIFSKPAEEAEKGVINSSWNFDEKKVDKLIGTAAVLGFASYFLYLVWRNHGTNSCLFGSCSTASDISKKSS